MLMKKYLIFCFIVLIALLSGCGQSSNENLAETEAFDSALQTAVVETIAAALPDISATPETSLPTEDIVTDDPQQPTATVPPLPTQTSPPAEEATQSSSGPTNTPQTPCYRGELISETVPDGTKFPPGQYFTKIWVIRNTGVCAWNEDFRWTLVEGEDFTAPTDLTLNQIVNPGEDLEVKLELKTPLLEGLYQGTYKIFTDEGGEVTPLGFWVTIISEKE
jgi:hypothetical protein